MARPKDIEKHFKGGGEKKPTGIEGMYSYYSVRVISIYAQKFVLTEYMERKKNGLIR